MKIKVVDLPLLSPEKAEKTLFAKQTQFINQILCFI
jgi:hypothetical protein